MITEVIDVQLEQEAVGFVLNVNRVGPMLKDGYAYENWHVGPKWWHHAKVEWIYTPNSENAIYVEMWSKYNWSSGWKKKVACSLYESNPSTEYYYSNYRIRVRVIHNWKNYAVYFKHWESDDWERDH